MKVYPVDSPEHAIHNDLKALIEKVKPMIFSPGTNPSDDETLGIIVSKFCEWDISRIETVSMEAFEDSNVTPEINYSTY